MSISFACPECRARIEVNEELAGHAGQCPRCQNVIVIPAPNQPIPVPAAPEAPSRGAAKPAARTAAAANEPPARRRRTPPPRQPTGPIWPWVVGIFSAVVMLALLFSSFAVLVFWRRPDPRPPVPTVGHNQGALHHRKGVLVGQLEGTRAVMQNGVFQIRTELTNNDPIDPKSGPGRVLRCKRYEIELRGDRSYVIELDSNRFDSYIRVENLQGKNGLEVGQIGVANARMVFNPNRADVFIIYASCVDEAIGEFTLTIREQQAAKPFVP